MEGKAVAIVLAGGEGVRMDADCPKQFLELVGRPVIAHSLAAFAESECITDIVIVCHSDYIDRLNDIIKEHGIEKVYTVVAGGRTRQESSFIGVKNCPTETKYVLIHDAVRPLVGIDTIERTLEAAVLKGAVTSAIMAADTIVEVKGGCITGIPSRDTMMRVQTPQGFRYALILEAHEKALSNGIADATDDCGLILAMGASVAVITGRTRNIKLTDQTDLEFAEKLFRDRSDKMSPGKGRW